MGRHGFLSFFHPAGEEKRWGWCAAKKPCGGSACLAIDSCGEGIAGSNRRPCPLFREARFGNRPIPIRQRCMRQPRAIGMVLCGVFAHSTARPQQDTFQSRSVSNHQDRHFLHWQHHPASALVLTRRSHRTRACEAVQLIPGGDFWTLWQSFRDGSPEAAPGRSWGPCVKPGCCGTNHALMEVLVSP